MMLHVQVLYRRQKHELPPAKISGDHWYLVYGGSTAVGMFAVQLAKLAGYKVIATASEKNFDLVKSYGADEVVDVSALFTPVSRVSSLDTRLNDDGLGLTSISRSTRTPPMPRPRSSGSPGTPSPSVSTLSLKRALSRSPSTGSLMTSLWVGSSAN